MNRTAIPPHTGSGVWLYRIFEHQAVPGDKRALEKAMTKHYDNIKRDHRL